ncbi:sulfate transporter [Ensifer adhaerens]|nr:sulfate transporter [Ensifer adhaerens]
MSRTAGIIVFNGREGLEDARGGWTPLQMVKPEHKLEDEVVRKTIAFAIDLNQQIARFFNHTMLDLDGLDALLTQEYEVTKGGKKGNRTYLSYDGLMKVQVQVADLLTFGPELQAAKFLIDECLNEWSADSRPEIQTIVTRAFNTDQEGKINRSEVFALLRLEIEDARWQRAMQAISDAVRVIGSKEYLRFYRRKTQQADWQAITINLAKA